MPKDCFYLDAPSDDDDLVEAICKAIREGNYRARFHPETVKAWTEKVDDWWRRRQGGGSRFG